MRVDLTSKEWQVITEALERGPDPEQVSFGPAYEIQKKEMAGIAMLIRDQLRKQRR